MIKKFEYTKKMLLSLITMLILFIFLETLARVGFFGIYEHVVTNLGPPYHEWLAISENKELGYEFEREDNQDNDRKKFNMTPSPGVFRIVAIGDSVTNGPVPENYPKILNEILNNSSKKNNFEVLNFGIPGYNAAQKEFYLKERVLKYKPDLIIFQLLSDDIYAARTLLNASYIVDNSTGVVVEMIEERPIPISIPLPLELNRFLLKNSIFYRFLSTEYYYAKRSLDVAFNPDYYSSRYEAAKEALQNIKKVSDERNNSLVVVLFPDTTHDFKNYPVGDRETYFYNWFKNATKELGLNSLDLYDTFKNYNYLDVRFDNGGHLNQKGNYIGALAIFNYLIKGGLTEKSMFDETKIQNLLRL